MKVNYKKNGCGVTKCSSKEVVKYLVNAYAWGERSFLGLVINPPKTEEEKFKPARGYEPSVRWEMGACANIEHQQAVKNYLKQKDFENVREINLKEGGEGQLNRR